MTYCLSMRVKQPGSTYQSALLDFARSTSNETVFVLDDYHLIDEPMIHQAAAHLLTHLPPTFCLMLAGRVNPPLPLARYRARGVLLKIRSDELAFSTTETADFSNARVGLICPTSRSACSMPNWRGGSGIAVGLADAPLATRCR